MAMITRLWVRYVLMVLLGLYFVDTLLSGRAAFYINESFFWLTGFAGGAFLLLGIAGILELLRAPKMNQTDRLERGPKAHQHGVAPSWVVLGIVAVPLALGVLVPARPLGAAAVSATGFSSAVAAVPSASGSASFSIPPSERNLLDWMRAFGSSANLSEFNGQEVDVIGFVYRDIRLDEQTQFFVMRFIVSCCVADASSVGLVVEVADASQFAPDTWLRIKGKLRVKSVLDQLTPVIMAESLEAVPQVAHPYLYP
jgi:uncharacterized repeat protein (TIGR03943 family)